MRGKTARVLCGAVGCVTLLAGMPATAGPPGNWSRVNSRTVSNTTEVGLARTADGLLHVVWMEQGDPNVDPFDHNLMHRTVGPDGSLGPATEAIGDWDYMNPVPDLVLQTDGTLRAYVGGSPPNTAGGLYTATSADGGATWSVPALVNDRTFWGAEVTAIQLDDGTHFQQTGTLLHRTLDLATPDVDLEPQWGGCCVYGARLGVDDVSGELWTAVYATESSPPDPPEVSGAYVQELDPATGAPVGATIQMPGTSVDYLGENWSSNPGRRLPLTSRVGGGMFLAFNMPRPDSLIGDVLVWRVGDASSYRIARYTQGLEDSAIAMAAAPDGRMWVLWATESVPAKVYASISNVDVTAWSPPASAKVFGGDDYGDIYGIQANATDTRLDFFVNIADVDNVRVSHTQFAVPPEWSSGADDIDGTAGADYMYGGGGDDNLAGAGGKDQMYGGDGNDRLNGGAGKDVLNGGKGKDVCVVTKGDKTKSCEKVITKRHR